MRRVTLIVRDTTYTKHAQRPCDESFAQHSFDIMFVRRFGGVFGHTYHMAKVYSLNRQSAGAIEKESQMQRMTRYEKEQLNIYVG